MTWLTVLQLLSDPETREVIAWLLTTGIGFTAAILKVLKAKKDHAFDDLVASVEKLKQTQTPGERLITKEVFKSVQDANTKAEVKKSKQKIRKDFDGC